MGAKISDKDWAELLRERATADDPEFQYQVGRCYWYGTKIEQNIVEAVKWYRLAAEQGHAIAQQFLGCAFATGVGVEKDMAEAIIWFKLAAEQGYSISQNELARSYENGEGVTQDYNEARRFYNLSAEQGYWRASRNLGRIYQYGKGVEKDIEKAKHHYEKALAGTDSGTDSKGDLATEADKQAIQERIAEVTVLLAEEEKKRQEAAVAAALALRIAARTQVFISYAHKDMTDIDYVGELRTHLKTLQRTREIEWWDDTRINPGEKWDEKIQEALARAKVIVLLVSADFIASEYVWNKELPKILDAARDEGATILWLLVSACDYEDTDIADYQAVMAPDKSLAMRRIRPERDEVYTTLVKRIKELFK